jgi:uracil-DNA glycosylase family 4
MDNPVPGIGSPNPEIMILGEAPGKNEAEQLQPFVGAAGIILDRICKGIGHPNWRNEAYISNVYKYLPPYNPDIKNYDWNLIPEDRMKEALDFLMKEIQMMNPNLILVLGTHAYKALDLPGKLDDYRGSILQALGRKVVATYHPARFLYSRESGQFSWKPFEKAIFQFDVKRAFDESRFRPANLPKRSLRVVEDSNQLIQFLNRWEPKADKFAEDIESINHIPFCTSICFHPSESISIPLFDGPLGKTRSRKDIARIWLILDKIHNNPKFKIVGQNFKYDEPKLRKLGLWIHKLHSDTMLKGHVICPEFPKNLAFQTSIYTREPFYKHEYESFKQGKTDIQRFMQYNAKDSAVTLEIDNLQEQDLIELDALDFYYEFVMPLHYLYMELEDNGIAISEDIRMELIHQWCRKQAEIEIELFKLIGMHVNVASPKQVQLALYEKLKLPFRAGTGEDVLVALLGNHAKKPEQKRAIKLILLDRKVRRLLSTTLASPADYDGRMRTSVFIAATETRRTSNQLLKEPIRPYNMGIGFQTLSKHGEAGAIRKMFVPDPGYVFINFDQSQAEARVCSLLADDELTLKNFDEIDIHAMTASWAFGKTWQDWSKKRLGYECPERFIGKTLRHAGHLDMQKHTCMLTINTDAEKFGIDVEVSEWKAGELLKVFHAYTPKIREIFHLGIQEALQRDGMFLRGTSPCMDKNWFPPRQFYGDWDRDLWKEAYAYIPQQTVTDKTKWILTQLSINAKYLKIVGEAHDAGLLLCPDRLVDEAYDTIKFYGEQPIDFSKCSIPRRNLIIPIDVEIGRENYKDLKKYSKVSPEVRVETVSVKEIDAKSIFKQTRI